MCSPIESGISFSTPERELPRQLAKKVIADLDKVQPGSFSKQSWEEPLIQRSFILDESAFNCKVTRRYLSYGLPLWVNITIRDFSPDENGLIREVIIGKVGVLESYSCHKVDGSFRKVGMDETERLSFLRAIFQSDAGGDTNA